MMILLAIPVFILAYLAGRLTEDMGFLFAMLGAMLVGFILFLLSSFDPVDGLGLSSRGPGSGYGLGLLVLVFVFLPAALLNAAAGVGGYRLGQLHRPRPDDD